MIETLKKKERKTEVITFRARPTVRKKLEAVAEKEDRNISFIVNRMLENIFKISA